MKVFKNYDELAKGINKTPLQVEEAWETWLGRSYMYVDDIEVKIHIKGNEIHFVVFNNEDNEECKQYMMQYEIHEYLWKVYVDEIEGWRNCKVLDITNTRLGIDRATVVTSSGTQLNRICKFIIDEDDEDFKQDGCIYFYEKVED